ncbi:MAG: dienelactone hydrolase family protein [Rickettsiaceae bacterium]|nr:dienelactone hydrolase family protein [Rickettsiaceae bacterium]
MKKHLLVLLHGLGSNGDDLAALCPYFESLKDVEFFSPDGIEPCDLFPFGYQWFSLANRDGDVMKSELERVAPKIRRMISDKAALHDISEDKIILLGFSQGTMTSLYLALTNEVPYKAVVGFSGSLITPNEVIQRETPICLIHGMEDDVVPAHNLKIAEEALKKEGMNVSSFLFPDIAHSIDMRGIKTAIEFLKREIEK